MNATTRNVGRKAMSRKDFNDCRAYLDAARVILRDNIDKLTDAASRSELRLVHHRVDAACFFLEGAEREQAGDECEHCGAPPEKQDAAWRVEPTLRFLDQLHNLCPACGADHTPKVSSPPGLNLDVDSADEELPW